MLVTVETIDVLCGETAQEKLKGLGRRAAGASLDAVKMQQLFFHCLGLVLADKLKVE